MSTIIDRLKWKSIDGILREAISERDSNLRDRRDRCFGDYVTVRLHTSSLPCGMVIPDLNGEGEEYAVFHRMTLNDSMEFDELALRKQKIGERNGEDIFEKILDTNEYHRLFVMKNLVEWSLDIPIEKDRNGWMTDNCWKRVSHVCGTLLDAFVTKFALSNEISEEESQKMDKQSIALFNASGNGVMDACEGVTKFCTYGNFSEKFNLNISDIKSLSFREYLLLKHMISNESDRHRITMAQLNKPVSNTRISTGGGMRPSRGTIQPMPGSNGR